MAFSWHWILWLLWGGSLAGRCDVVWLPLEDGSQAPFVEDGSQAPFVVAILKLCVMT